MELKKSFIIFFLVVLSLPTASRAQKGEITLSQIWTEGYFQARTVSGIKSMNDGVHYTSLRAYPGGKCIVKYAYKSGNAVDTIVKTEELIYEGRPINFSAYSFNPTESKLLLAIEQEAIYRHSSKSNYFAYDLDARILVPITDFSLGKQQLAQFSPTENKVAFVRSNNLYLSDLDAGTELQITTDGEWGKIINGAVDWVYEEEFSFHRGFYWSPEGSKIAFYRFDESEVKEFDLTYYSNLYPDLYTFKYPKAGEKNSTVEVQVYNLDQSKSIKVDVGSEQDQYIPRIKWTQSDDELCIMRMNRLQNELEFLIANFEDVKENEVEPTRCYYEKSDTYIEINDNLIFLKDKKHFLWNSEKDGWNHIYLYDLDGNEVAQLTKGKWEVVSFYGTSQKRNEVYFSAAIDNSISEEIYALDYSKFLKKGNKAALANDSRKQLKELTPNGKTNTAVFSDTFEYFINFASSAAEPEIITLRSHSGEVIRTIEDNALLAERVSKLDLSPKEFGVLENRTGVDLNYWMIKPPDFDAGKQYPLMFMIYGGPGSNEVTDEWEGATYLWHQMLAQDGYIIVCVDPRGTKRKGRDFKHSTYLQLGKHETEDFIDAAKHFGKMQYIDSERIGMMGWSYGGYMSSLCMTKGAEYFKLGIAVAPVTNWRYYDSIYTERFMRTPQENPDGYDDNSPINHVDKLKGHFLLIHGSADDNVHLQNTMEMVTALVEANKQFDLFVYPNKNHSIYGGNTRYHLFTKMTNFIKENL